VAVWLEHTRRTQAAASLLLTMPVGNVLVGDAGGDIEHDDTGLAVDVVTIAETAKLFLSSSVPHIEDDGSKILRLCQREIAHETRCLGEPALTVVKLSG
jgi:hypothetical protein